MFGICLYKSESYHMIKFSCSQCGRNYEVEDKYSGKSVRCKKCNNKITIPTVVQVNEQTQEYELADEDYVVTQSQSDNSKSPYGLDNETKPCPYCGEEILEVAKKCKHCGEFLEIQVPIPHAPRKKLSKSRIPVLAGSIVLVFILSVGVYLLFFTGIFNPESQERSRQVSKGVDNSEVAPEYIEEFEKVVKALRRLDDNITSGSVNYSEFKNLFSDYLNSFSDLGEWLGSNSVPEDARISDLLTNMKAALDSYNYAVSNWGNMINNVDSGYLSVQYKKSRDRNFDFALFQGQIVMSIYKSIKKNEPIEAYEEQKKSILGKYKELTDKYKEEDAEQEERIKKME